MDYIKKHEKAGCYKVMPFHTDLIAEAVKETAHNADDAVVVYDARVGVHAAFCNVVAGLHRARVRPILVIVHGEELVNVEDAEMSIAEVLTMVDPDIQTWNLRYKTLYFSEEKGFGKTPEFDHGGDRGVCFRPARALIPLHQAGAGSAGLYSSVYRRAVASRLVSLGTPVSGADGELALEDVIEDALSGTPESIVLPKPIRRRNGETFSLKSLIHVLWYNLWCPIKRTSTQHPSKYLKFYLWGDDFGLVFGIERH